MKTVTILVGLAGLALGIGIIAYSGAGHVLHAALSVGWSGLAAFAGAQLALTCLLATAWFTLLPNGGLKDFPRLILSRMVRDAGGQFLPFLHMGGFVMGVRTATLMDIPWPLASASTMADVTAEFMAEIGFAAIGLAILVVWQPGSELIVPLAAGLGVACVAGLALILMQKGGRRVFSFIASRIGRLNSKAWNGRMDRLQAEIIVIYAQRGRIAFAAVLHLAGWFGTGVLAWFGYRLLGLHVPLSVVLAIEAMLRAILTLTFFIPGNAGVKEAAYAGLGALFGLPVDISLALSLLSRARDLVLAVPALLAWQGLEMRRLRRGPAADAATLPD